MKLLITAALSLTVSGAAAQANRISIGVHALSLRDLSANLPEQQKTSGQRQIMYLPSIGYYRMLGRSFGAGVELGYAGGIERTSYSYRSGNYLQEQGTETAYREFYICPVLLESAFSKNGKYNFLASISLPMSYAPSGTSTAFYRSSSGGPKTGTEWTAPSGSALRLGLFLSGGIQRRLFSGLYAGLQAGIGGTYLRSSAKGTQVAEIFDGLRTHRSEVSIDNKERAAGMEVRPMISLNYYF